MKKHPKTKKKITNQIIFNEFSQIHSQFSEIHQQFKKIDERFEKIDQHFEQLELMVKVGFDEVDQRFVDLETNLSLKIRHAVAPLPTKDFVDQRIGQLRGEFVHSKHNLA